MNNGIVKPILLVGVGYHSTENLKDEEIKTFLSEICTECAKKTDNQYHVICIVDYTFERGLNLRVL